MDEDRGNGKKQGHRFGPGSHATIYLLALVYLGYLLLQLILRARDGGADAPSTGTLVAGVLVLGGGMAVLAVLAWKILHMPRQEDEPEESDPERLEAPDDPDGPQA